MTKSFFSKNQKVFASAFIVILVIIDQLIKLLVESTMQINESIPIINNVLHITLFLSLASEFISDSRMTSLHIGRFTQTLPESHRASSSRRAVR